MLEERDFFQTFFNPRTVQMEMLILDAIYPKPIAQRQASTHPSSSLLFLQLFTEDTPLYVLWGLHLLKYVKHSDNF